MKPPLVWGVGRIAGLQSMAAGGKLVQYHAQDAGPKRPDIFRTRLACFLAGAGEHACVTGHLPF